MLTKHEAASLIRRLGGVAVVDETGMTVIAYGSGKITGLEGATFARSLILRIAR